jgi:hypothetical protein
MHMGQAPGPLNNRPGFGLPNLSRLTNEFGLGLFFSHCFLLLYQLFLRIPTVT